jgi:hypothetical protein
MWALFVGGAFGAILGGSYGVAVFLLLVAGVVWAIDALTQNQFGK